MMSMMVINWWIYGVMHKSLEAEIYKIFSSTEGCLRELKSKKDGVAHVERDQCWLYVLIL